MTIEQRLAEWPEALAQYRRNVQPFIEARQRAPVERLPLIDACLRDIRAHWHRQVDERMGIAA